MSDVELEDWKREWREQADPFPGLKRKIVRQNLWMAARITLLLLCMALSMAGALRFATPLMIGLFAGIWTTAVIVGTFDWWVRRRAWKVVAQTTLAYAELSHRRAVAKARTLRFSIIYLLIALLLLGGIFAWSRSNFSTLAALVLAALVIELLVFRFYLQPRGRREIEESAKLLADVREITQVETIER